MAIKRYTANADNTITNAFAADLVTRGTGSNMGAADILEVFSLYGQGNSTTSAELSRALVQFPVSQIRNDRVNGNIPVSGSVSFYLRMFNAKHSEQLPRNFTLNVLAVSQSWQEGTGLDMEGYKDITKDTIDGSNWSNRQKGVAWEKIGGSYHSSSYVSGSTMPNYTATFSNGTEDIDLDVTEAVEEWISENQENYGFGVFLPTASEAYNSNSSGVDTSILIHNTAGAQASFYTKRFFSRSSEFFFKKPYIEARWDSRVEDDRGNFYASSSMVPGSDNVNNVYLYNFVRGSLKDIPHTETITVKLFASTNGTPSGNSLTSATATKISTGVYKAQLTIDTAETALHDVWSGSVGGPYKTGSISVKSHATDNLLYNNTSQYVSKITNLKPVYVNEETARLRVFTRRRNTSPTIYTVATSNVQGEIIQSASYEIVRMVDNATVIQNSTGSSNYQTFMSYDTSGSYFDLDMGMLEPGYMYGIKLSFFTLNGWREQEQVFKFRVENN
tara:strand:+ start:3578 stop:5083 length:1506 start_codon:yes stop_codon:yes gene_type:complete